MNRKVYTLLAGILLKVCSVRETKKLAMTPALLLGYFAKINLFVHCNCSYIQPNHETSVFFIYTSSDGILIIIVKLMSSYKLGYVYIGLTSLIIGKKYLWYFVTGFALFGKLEIAVGGLIMFYASFNIVYFF